MNCKEFYLHSDDLDVTLVIPQNELFSERFAADVVVGQVVLHRRHRFCQPEQRIPGRVTCNGLGLCGEFVWDELACEAAPGEVFPKIGVGFLRQRPEGGAYDMWKHYEAQPFPVEHWMQDDYTVVFRQKPKEALGVSATLTKAVRVYRNEITLTTTLENTGSRDLSLYEYQHNFVAIDDIPVGPGYRLEIPFDGTLDKLPFGAVRLEDYTTPVPGLLKVENGKVLWNKRMERVAYHKVTEREDILSCPEYTWRLSHEKSDASISETVHFVPAKLVIWGIEHCVCAEVYNEWNVPVGGRQTFARTWRFEDSNIH